MQTTEPGDVVTLTTHGWAHGGEAVGRLPEGKACFVGYALPEETVRVRIEEVHKRWARGTAVEVVEASPHRVEPPCPHYGPDRCGGCQLQHAAPEHQRQLKRRVLVEQLQRLGKVADPPVGDVSPVPGGWPDGYRAWARMAADPAGRLGFRRQGSHEVHPVDRCLLLTDDAQALREAAGDGWQGVEEVHLVAGDDAGLLTISPGPGGVPAAPDGDFGVALRGVGEPTTVRPPGEVTMVVHGRALRVSAGAFFQAGPAAAEALVDAVMAAAEVAPGERVLDLYAGVGLFAGALAAAGAQVVAVESSASATADARHNLDGAGVEVITADVAAALREVDGADVVVLDPPRTGAGPRVAATIAGLGPRRIVYVACDPAALARDTRALLDAGMALSGVTGIDVFGHTSHVEAVAVFDRAAP